MRRAGRHSPIALTGGIVPLDLSLDCAGWVSLASRPAAPVRNALARVLDSVPALPLIRRTAATAPTGRGPPPSAGCRPLSVAHPPCLTPSLTTQTWAFGTPSRTAARICAFVTRPK